jgi:SAM-dependent methyltransferase
VRELPAAARLLELGPGAGHVALLARRPDLRWTGLESSPDCLPALARRLTGGAIVDVEALPRLPPGCDAVLAADALEHLADPERVLRLAHAALRPGGRLLLSVPNVANLYVRLNLLVGRFPYADRGILDRTHRTFYTARSLRRLVEGAGFAVERTAVSTIPLPLAWPRLRPAALAALSWGLAVATRALPRLLGYQLLVDARRP